MPYSRANVGFAAAHVVGSNNSLEPWDGRGQTAPTPEQLAEVKARTEADLKLIDATFDKAIQSHQKAVVMLMQADMFDPTVNQPDINHFQAFNPLCRKSLNGRRNSVRPSICSTATVTSLTTISR